MKLKTLVGAALMTAITATAYAGTESKEMVASTPPSDAGFYVAVYGGANFSQDYGNERAEVSAPSFISNASFDLRGTSSHDSLGGVGGLKFGYNFQSFDIGGGFGIQPAVELEGFYLGSTTDIDYSSSVSLGGTTFSGQGKLKGDLDSAAFFLNGIFRLKTGTCFTPYLGAGVGGEYMSLSNVSVSGSATETVDSETTTLASGSAPLASEDTFVFAAQALAGFDIEVAQHWDIFTEYKYVVGFNPDFDFGQVATLGGVGINAKFDPSTIGQQLVTAGVKYNF